MANESQKNDLIDSSAAKQVQESTNLISRESLLARLRRGAEARAKFVESNLSKGIAFQIRSLRDREDLSQPKMAEQLGMTQNQISRLENPNYGKPTITTLKRIAAFFDVALVVRFVPFSQLVDWVSGTSFLDNGLSPEAFAVPSFAQESRVSLGSIGAEVTAHGQEMPLGRITIGRTPKQPSAVSEVNRSAAA